MSYNSGPMVGEGLAHLVTAAELLEPDGRVCGQVGPAMSRCMRRHHHVPPHGALGTDGEGQPVVVTWYRTERFPIVRSEPGE